MKTGSLMILAGGILAATNVKWSDPRRRGTLGDIYRAAKAGQIQSTWYSTITCLADLDRRGHLPRYNQRLNTESEASARRVALQLEVSEGRERRHLRELGEARARIAELEATVEPLKAMAPSPRAARPKRASSVRAKAYPQRLASTRRAARRSPARKPKQKAKVAAKKTKQRAGRKTRARRR